MTGLILPFAETLSDNGVNFDDNISFAGMQEDFLNSNFPSLFSTVSSSTTSVSSNNNWNLVNGKKDTMSENNAVSINGRPYAEVAAKAGVHHDPVLINNSCTITKQQQRHQRMHDKSQHHPHTPCLSTLNSYYTTDESNFNFDKEDPWYQIKYGRSRKHETNFTIRQRRQKTLEKAFQQATSEYLALPRHHHQQQQLTLALNNLQEACHHIDEFKELKERIPELYYHVKRKRSISWMKSYPEGTRQLKIGHSLTKDNQNRLIEREIRNRPFVKRVFLDALRERYGYQSSIQALNSMTDPKLDYSDIEYIARNYCISYDYKTISDYETKIIPNLKEGYHRALRKHIQVFSDMLPSPKDKSVCRISSTQYARAVLLLIEINSK